ncbi:MAG TPA: hypothetical protein VGG32_08470 [Thermoplasmata archaeon]|jgi:hypothetical protein
MPPALETINTYGTGTGAATTLAHVADPLQSLYLRSANGSPAAYIGPIWAYLSAAADVILESPRMHDVLHAVQTRAQASLVTPLWEEGLEQADFSVDLLNISTTYGAAPGNGVAEDVGFNVYYPDLGGSAAAFATWSQIQPSIKQYLGVKVSATSSATAGAYGAGVAINSTYDEFKSDTTYALLGYNVSAACGNVAIQGADTGNYLVGGPGAVDPLVTRQWFVKLTNDSGYPLIPLIKANNKGSTNVFVSHTTASTTIIVTLLFAWLG